MWSLAVEEQFYLVWPLTMIALALPSRNARRSVTAIVGVAWRSP
jgi:peptidoglycan/LPS O-acetylase OafA/YrhL